MSDLGRWTGLTTTLLPGVTFAAPNALFPTQQRNDGSVYSFTSSTSTLTLPSSGLADGYLIIARVRFKDTSNGRVSIAGRIQQASGTGNFVNGQSGGYSRNNNNDDLYISCFGFVNNPSASATFQFEWERESDAPAGGTNLSSFEVIPFFYSNHGIYSGTNTTLMGGTTRNVVPIGSTVNESDTAAIERATNVVTVKGDNKRYFVISSQWYQNRGEPSTTRTQRIFGHDYDGSADLAAQSYAYYRQGSADGTGGHIHDLLETVTANRTIEMTCFRGLGVSSGQGGADVDGQAPSQGVQALVVLELNDSAEVFRTNDPTGLQALDATSPLDLNVVRTGGIDFNDSASFVRANDTGMNCEAAFDGLFGSNIWAASTAITSGERGTFLTNITVDGVEEVDCFHGNYIRGNQGSEDTFGFGSNPFGFIAVALDEDVGVSTTNAGADAEHATDTQAGTVGFWGINLDTLESAGGITVTPAAAIAASSGIDPTVVLGNLTISPGAGIANSTAIDPGVVLGSLSISPAAAVAASSAIDPGVVFGSLSITPGAAIANSTAIDPTVVLGSMSFTPGAAIANSTAIDPTVVLGSLSITPGAASAVASAPDPGVTVAGGGVAVTPAAAIAVASAIDPGVILGSLSITPGAAISVASAPDPGVVLGNLSITPAFAASASSALDPVIVLGSLAITPGSGISAASAIDPGVIFGSLTIGPALSSAVFTAIDPNVIEGGGALVTPAAAVATATAIDPIVVLASLAITPAAAISATSAIDPNVVEGGGTLVTPAAAVATATAIDPSVILGSVTVAPAFAAVVASAPDPSLVLSSMILAPAFASMVASALDPNVLMGFLLTPDPGRTCNVQGEDREYKI